MAVPVKPCVVFVPAQRPSLGTHYYNVGAASSFAAAWEGIQKHEQRMGTRVPDDALIRVVVEGRDSMMSNHEEYNRKKPNHLHIAGRVRAWAELNKESA